MELISLHVPKCAGSSLREALIRAFGEQAIFFDNADRLLDPRAPINVDRRKFVQDFKSNRASALKGKRAVHGHFCMRKYDGVDAPRVTFLRDPVDRVISHYLFWQHLPPHGHSLHDRFLAERPSVTDFAKIPEMRRFYRDVLFLDVDMNVFDLIGCIERMDESMARFEKLIGKKLPLERRNANACNHCKREKAKMSRDARLMSSLRDLLADDIAFYEKHAGGVISQLCD